MLPLQCMPRCNFAHQCSRVGSAKQQCIRVCKQRRNENRDEQRRPWYRQFCSQLNTHDTDSNILLASVVSGKDIGHTTAFLLSLCTKQKSKISIRNALNDSTVDETLSFPLRSCVRLDLKLMCSRILRSLSYTKLRILPRFMH